jgi:hypothetical protein
MNFFSTQTKRLLLGLLTLSSLVFATSTSQKDKTPVCQRKQGQSLDINASEVINWKHNTPNKYENRGHIQGSISKLFPNKNGHRHFEVTFQDKTDEDTIEIVYNEDFGALPELQLGMNVEACGDYITATDVSGPYPPSPDGAIIHWVHQNPSGKGHPDGFVIIEGSVYGYGRAQSETKPETTSPTQPRNREETF